MNTSKKKQKLFRFLIVVCIVLIAACVTPFIVEKVTETMTNKSAEATTAPVEEKKSLAEITENTKKEQGETKGSNVPTTPNGKMVYLTFDDGPSSLTGEFLDVLKENGVGATFFMQGNNLKNTSYHENVKRVIEEGHYLGAHSMTHNSRKLYTNKQFVLEMKETVNLIREITNTNPTLVRAPYGTAPGLNDKQLRDQTVEAGLKVWDWTLDTEDWKLRGKPDQVVQKVKQAPAHRVEVVLMHEQSQTLEALPEIINYYKEKGYQFGVYDETQHFVLNFQNDQRL